MVTSVKMNDKKKVKFESFYGFALSGAVKKGDSIAVGFQFNVCDTHSDESKLVMIQHILDDIAYPEIMRKVKQNKLDDNFQFHQVHILMYSDPKKNEILFNEDVRLSLNVTYKNKTPKQGDVVHYKDLKEILGIYPDKKNHPNAAHIMMVKFSGKWYFAANMIYNRQDVQEKFETAYDYVKTVKNAYEEENWRPFIDNLFTVTELIMQSILELHHHNQHSHTQTHQKTRKLFRTFCENENAPISYIENYEMLGQERKKARYNRGTHGRKYTLEHEIAEHYLSIAESMIEYTEILLKTTDTNSKHQQGEYISTVKIKK